MILEFAIAVGAFLLGVVVVVWSTERLLAGMIGLASLLRLAPFAIAGIFSGLEAENVAVGLVAAHGGVPEVALGTVFGGGIFIVCIALGLGAVLAPLRVDLPRGVLVTLGVAPALAGLALIGGSTPRLAGVVLLAAFALGIGYVVLSSRTHHFLDADDVWEPVGRGRPWWRPLLLTLFGIAAITVGAELVTFGAERMIVRLAVPAAVVGMVATPAAIELEEVIRQAVPAREGRPDVSAGNLVGTVLYFVLFNLGLIALVAPVQVSPLTRTLDWPFLVASTWVATAFLWRGGVSRVQGAVLVALYAIFVGAHLVLR
ncbi:MAG: sodium:calcium antiporter [Chloroflexi bacterium]|nr:MAG: sodium:calcium antiporter [Chloroflexota bacterium]